MGSEMCIRDRYSPREPMCSIKSLILCETAPLRLAKVLSLHSFATDCLRKYFNYYFLLCVFAYFLYLRIFTRDTLDVVKQSAALCLLKLFKTDPSIIPSGESRHWSTGAGCNGYCNPVSILQGVSRHWQHGKFGQVPGPL